MKGIYVCHWILRHCVVSLSKNSNPSLEMVQPRKTRPIITEVLLMGRKESTQTNKQNNKILLKNAYKSKQPFEHDTFLKVHTMPMGQHFM